MNPRILKQTLCALAVLLSILPLHTLVLAEDATAVKYLITNDNTNPNTATFYKIGGTQTAPTLTLLVAVGTGGAGNGAGGVSVAMVGSEPCAYISNGASENITAISILKRKYVGIYNPSATDSGLSSTVTNGTYLYAAFGLFNGNTIATFQVNAGCGLTFVGDVYAYGLNTFSGPQGMALHGSMLVVTYADGSIESFNTSAGLPVSNGDKQNASGHSHGLNPIGVDISKNGQYAVFGDNGGPVAVEVSDISSGKLTPTVLYENLGAGAWSTNVLLSPGGGLLYIADYDSNQVSAARFSETSGRVAAGCVSAGLNGGSFPLSLAMASTSGTGGVIYVADALNGFTPFIDMLSVGVVGKQCTLTEHSPVSDPNGNTGMGLSIAVWPPRPF